MRRIQQRVDEYIGQFEEGYFHPLTNLARLAEEVGELARELNHQYGQKTKKKDEEEGNIALELGDILFIVACFANSMDIDLDKAFDDVIDKYEKRDKERWTRKKDS